MLRPHRDIANALADTLSHNYSSAFSIDAFTPVRNKAKQQNLNLLSEVYNRPFSMEEMQDATSAGPHEIHYQLL